jgi:hypothetical protein
MHTCARTGTAYAAGAPAPSLPAPRFSCAAAGTRAAGLWVGDMHRHGIGLFSQCAGAQDTALKDTDMFFLFLSIGNCFIM